MNAEESQELMTAHIVFLLLYENIGTVENLVMWIFISRINNIH